MRALGRLFHAFGPLTHQGSKNEQIAQKLHHNQGVGRTYEYMTAAHAYDAITARLPLILFPQAYRLLTTCAQEFLEHWSPDHFRMFCLTNRYFINACARIHLSVWYILSLLQVSTASVLLFTSLFSIVWGSDRYSATVDYTPQRMTECGAIIQRFSSFFARIREKHEPNYKLKVGTTSGDVVGYTSRRLTT